MIKHDVSIHVTYNKLINMLMQQSCKCYLIMYMSALIRLIGIYSVKNTHRGVKVLSNDSRWQNFLFYKCCYHLAASISTSNKRMGG